MKATAFEFRLRFWIILAIYTLGFVTPWDFIWPIDGSGPNAHVWGLLAVMLSKGGAMSIAAAFNLVLIVAILFALVGACLRTWGSACLGVDVMRDTAMRSDEVVAEGPYRYLRNPLYAGAWLMTVALALLMRPSGAVFTLVAIVFFQMRLILGEEAFLREKLGEQYARYCAEVPRLLPSLRKPTSQTSSRQVVVHRGARPRWGQAALAEIFMWGLVASYAVLGWRYDARLLMQCALVSLGVSLVVKGLAGIRTPS